VRRNAGTFSQYALGRLTAVQYPQTAAGVQMNDMYNNHKQQQTVTVNLDSTYAYNNEGKITAMTYPSSIGVGGTPVAGAGYNYIYDGMYRLGAMTDSNNNSIVSGVSYNAANQLLGMTYNGIGETRAYNVLNQLTSIVAGSSENLTYNYPTGTNNGKASSMYNAVSGETVTYTYDSLNRLATAAGSGWGEGYTFDPFGNLTTKKVTSGSGPSLSVSVSQANNQIQGLGGYDANGNAYMANAAYDVENHIYALVGNQPYTSYSYDAQNKRIFLWGGTSDANNNPTGYLVVAYSPSGQKLGTYQFTPGTYGSYQPFISVSLASSDQYFGGRRLAALDQLGSAGTYYPWGEAKGGTNPQDTWSYATYWRDSATGLDYANNRYYSNAYGRFMTPDPYLANNGGAGNPNDPGSWNKYAYTRGDPVNRKDPIGLGDENGDGDDSGDNDFTGGDPGGGTDATEGDDKTRRGNTRAEKRWDLALANLSNANNMLQNLKPSADCQSDLTALTKVNPGITLKNIQATANAGFWIDATTDTGDREQSLYTPGTSEYNFWNGTRTTIQQYFQQHPDIQAQAGFPISGAALYIFFRPSFVNSHSMGFDAALLMHELTHNLGIDDSDLLGALGFDTALPSDDATKKLAKDCFGVTGSEVALP
jgi:RHS repeat-associated protein